MTMGRFANMFGAESSGQPRKLVVGQGRILGEEVEVVAGVSASTCGSFPGVVEQWRLGRRT